MGMVETWESLIKKGGFRYKKPDKSVYDIIPLLKRHKVNKVLDLGCGFGSSTFPLLKLFPQADIIATELALPMLLILKEKLSGKKNASHCQLIQLNAEELDFKENSFDLIVGAAILHHLLNPDKTIRHCQKILKPGGLAIFFEPFEAGMDVLALIFQSILNHKNCRWWFEFTKKRYMKDSLILWQKMKNTHKNNPFFRTVDDKWLFKKSYFEKLASELSFAELTIFRLDQSNQPYTHLANEHFNKNFKAFPLWIKEIFFQYEEWLSDELKDELLTEGCVIFRK